jgi:hypothetical protein
MSRFRRWRCFMYVTLQAVAVLHLGHASGGGGIKLLSHFRVHCCHASCGSGVTFRSRFRLWRCYIVVTLQAVSVLSCCHASSKKLNNPTKDNKTCRQGTEKRAHHAHLCARQQ